MAKKKVKEVKPEIPKEVTKVEVLKEVIPEVIPKTLETVPITEVFKEVIGVELAERLQKGGWQLIDCHQTPQGMLYKFKEGK